MLAEFFHVHSARVPDVVVVVVVVVAAAALVILVALVGIDKISSSQGQHQIFFKSTSN